MEKLKQQARTFSIIGGIMYVLLALNEFYYLIKNVIIENNVLDLISLIEYVVFIGGFTAIAVFLFVNKPNYFFNIPVGAIILFFLYLLIFHFMPKWEWMFGDDSYILQFFIEEKQIRSVLGYVHTFVVNPIFSVLSYIFLVVAICAAFNKKSRAINYLWFLPLLLYIPIAILAVSYNIAFISYAFESLKYCNDFGEFFKIYGGSLISFVMGILYVIIHTIAVLMLGLWLKTKNRILRGEGPQIMEKPAQPIYRAPMQPQFERPAAPQPSVQPQFERPVTPQPSAQPQYHILAEAQNPPQTHQFKQQPPIDEFEKIKKYKELLDAGIITQEEFNQKKKEILNL